MTNTTGELMEHDGHPLVEQASNLPQTEAISFMQMIERASRDPNVDIDKMERLLQMHERMVDKKAEAEFNDALVRCQKLCGTISADANNPQTRSKYATYAKLDRALRPIYTAEDISISFGTEDSPKPEHIRVIAYASRKGYTRIYRTDMPSDGKGAKGGDVMTKTHAAGSAMSYGARYLLKGIFNISIGEDDDDGNGVGHPQGMSEKDLESWLAAIQRLTTDEEAKELWAKASAVTTKARDVEAHETLRTAMLAKRKELKAKAKEMPI
jgi:hypothetical protein